MAESKNIQELNKIRINPIPLATKWRDILGNIPKDYQWVMMIFGYSQSGKSSLALVLSNIFANYGKVLYNAGEEKLHTGTITERCRRLRVSCKNITFFENRVVEDLRTELAKDIYKYCVVDSANSMAMTIPELLAVFNLQKEFPKVSFILLCHGDKEMKNYVGPAKLQNLTDISIEMKKGDLTIRKNYYAKNNKEIKFNIFKN